MHSSAWLGPFLVYSNKLLPGGLGCSSCAGHQDVNPKASSNGSTLGKLSVASLVACANLGVGVPLYGVIKPFVKWYMRNLTIDINEDMEIYDINCRNLDQANPRAIDPRRAGNGPVQHMGVLAKIQIVIENSNF